MKKRAFTLAEVLVTILIIGVIAVLTLPALKGGVDEKLLDGQKKTFDSKLKESFRAMQLAGALMDEYDSTEDFVNAMKKHVNIAKTCEANKLSDCFTQKVFNDEKEEIYNMKNIKNSNDLNANFEEESDVMGLVFADGTTAIITHDPDCYVADKYDGNADLTECISMVYDVNGTKEPNALNTDVFELNIDNEKDDYGLSFQIVDIATADTYYSAGSCTYPNTAACWQAAINYCKKKGATLPSDAQLWEIAKKIYLDSGACTSSSSCTSSGICGYASFSCTDKTKMESDKLYSKLYSYKTADDWTGGINLWSNSLNTSYQRGNAAYYDGSSFYCDGIVAGNGKELAVCVK